MKPILSTLIVFSLLTLSCGNTSSKTVKLSQDEISTEETLETGSGIVHYTCPNGHTDGGSSAAGNCSVCNIALTHNQAFHATQSNNNTPNITNPAAVPAPANTAPSKNKEGVYHYTCAKGHIEGGAGAAGNCSVCGNALVHNQAFHNN